MHRIFLLEGLLLLLMMSIWGHGCCDVPILDFEAALEAAILLNIRLLAQLVARLLLVLIGSLLELAANLIEELLVELVLFYYHSI